jgi:hypothetical protein
MAIGAAVATALPLTLTEDRLFGQERDRLMARAHEVLLQERTRLADTVAAGVNDSALQLVSNVL